MSKSPIGPLEGRLSPIALLAGIFALAFALVVAASNPVLAATEDEAEEGPTGPRVAFVIGNAQYETFPSLKNADDDARLMANILKRLGFVVIEGYEVGLEGMQTLFRDNRELVDKAEAVLFYYAGHGFQIEGRNYLVPTDAALESAAAIASSTVRLDAIIGELQHQDRPTLIFLDACRNNPLPPSVELGDRQDGLAQVQTGENTFITFATQPGNVSNDGAGDHSPFATALAKHLETPGLSISDLVIAVRNETRELTLGKQSPWDQSSLLAQFYFTEEQAFDAGALIAAASEISNDPRLRATFTEAREEGLSFQAAVFRTRQRAVELLGQPAAPEVASLYISKAEPSSSNVVIGSTPPTNAVPDDEALGVVEQLMFSRPGEEAIDSEAIERQRARDLARQMQTELQRLGCYRMGIDGLWGPGSRRAFSNYLKQTRQSADDLSPSVRWYNRLVLESGRKCRAPAPIVNRPARVARTAPKATVPSTRRNSGSIRQRAVQGQSRKAKRARRTQRQNALPPDISMGVGIGL